MIEPIVLCDVNDLTKLDKQHGTLIPPVRRFLQKHQTLSLRVFDICDTIFDGNFDGPMLRVKTNQTERNAHPGTAETLMTPNLASSPRGSLQPLASLPENKGRSTVGPKYFSLEQGASSLHVARRTNHIPGRRQSSWQSVVPSHRPVAAGGDNRAITQATGLVTGWLMQHA